MSQNTTKNVAAPKALTTDTEILGALTAGLIDMVEAKRLLDGLKPAPKASNLTFKIAEKGGVSVYGLNARFPITLYADQWERLFPRIEELKAFVAKGLASGALKRKGE